MSAKAVDSLLSMETKGILYGGNLGIYRERLDGLALDDEHDEMLPGWARRVLCEPIPAKDRIRVALFHSNDCAARDGNLDAVVDTFLMKDSKRDIATLRKAKAEGRLKPPKIEPPRTKSQFAVSAERAAKRNSRSARTESKEWETL